MKLIENEVEKIENKKNCVDFWGKIKKIQNSLEKSWFFIRKGSIILKVLQK